MARLTTSGVCIERAMLAARGRSLLGLVTASCGQMQGSLTQAIHVASSRKANAAGAHKSP